MEKTIIMSLEKQQTLFKQIVKELIKPAFKAEGFTTSGQTFRKQENGFVKIFNIQQDTRDPQEINFIFNLGFFIPYVHDLAYSYVLLPDKIRESSCCYRTRVSQSGCNSQLGNKSEKWFKLSEEAKFETVKASVIKAVEVSIDLFRTFTTLYDLTNPPKKYKDEFKYTKMPKLGMGLTLIKLGDKELGMKLYNKGYADFVKWLQQMKKISEKLDKGKDKKDDFPERLWKKFKEITRELKIPVKDKNYY